MKFLITWATLAGLYLLAAGVKDKTELAVAVAAGLLPAALLRAVRGKWKGRFEIRPGELTGLLVPVPGKVLKDTWIIFAALGNLLIRRNAVEGFFLFIPYRPPGDGNFDSRIALVTAVSTLPPNTIVIGYDEPRGGLILHQLAGPAVKRREGLWPL